MVSIEVHSPEFHRACSWRYAEVFGTVPGGFWDPQIHQFPAKTPPTFSVLFAPFSHTQTLKG